MSGSALRKLGGHAHLHGVSAILAAMLMVALAPTPVWASAGMAKPAPGPNSEPLSAALAAGRVRVEDLHGREVFAYDETRLGVFDTLVSTEGRPGPVTALIALDSRLGFGRGCIAAPLRWMLDAPERRLLLVVTPEEFRAAAAAHPACNA